nr:MAG TPA: hypothetical protein [Caudoviricetes sp.]
MHYFQIVFTASRFPDRRHVHGVQAVFLAFCQIHLAKLI